MAAPDPIELGAQLVADAFDQYHRRFREVTRRSRRRFAQQDWAGLEADAIERLSLYRRSIDQVVERCLRECGEGARRRQLWRELKRRFASITADRDDLELGETFFNSMGRRLLHTKGSDPEVEFGAPFCGLRRRPGEEPLFRTYLVRDLVLHDVIARILADYSFACGYQDRARDARRVAHLLEARFDRTGGREPLEVIEMIRSVFYRNKEAYLIGRMWYGGAIYPLVLALLHRTDGVVVDAALLTQDEASIVFSFTWRYFHVDAPRPHELVDFLKTIMPRKRVAELYISLGHHKHGKTELFRELERHLETSADRFETAVGERGLVMHVFTLPSLDLVFKVIRDDFGYGKSTTREEVMRRYQMVFVRDRVGRLADAQEFEHLTFDVERFEPGLLDELERGASRVVHVERGRVDIAHLYVERRMVPLNLYLRQADSAAAERAVIDYGAAIKELAAANIFPGDLLHKNFGVTRHGRVVFYDYDELCLLDECRFRRLPEPRDIDEEMAEEPWFHVGERDIFPEELERFIAFPEPLHRTFLAHHADLFDPAFWTTLQRRHSTGEWVDVFPYPPERRLDHSP